MHSFESILNKFLLQCAAEFGGEGIPTSVTVPPILYNKILHGLYSRYSDYAYVRSDSLEMSFYFHGRQITILKEPESKDTWLSRNLPRAESGEICT
jgi:hypothetical protein